MNQHFVVTIRFLDRLFHGRQDGGELEWPPSPLRLFQALVAAAARGGELLTAKCVFEWLERQATQYPPIIVAPAQVTPTPPGYCLSVPNNAMDLVAKAWSKGNESNSGDANPATHRTMKNVRPIHMIDGDVVHYLWPLSGTLSDEERNHTDVLIKIARNLNVVGWGVDMVVGNGELLDEMRSVELPGERWLPSSKAASNGLRVPVVGTLNDLMVRHQGFLERLGEDGFVPPPLLTAYDKVEYRRAIDPPRREVAAFALLKPDASGFRPFNTTRWALTVAGMTRNATKRAAQAAPKAGLNIDSFILGHGESIDDKEHITVGQRRFAYIPVPSIEARGDGKTRVVGDIRRVILTAFDDACDAEINWARRALSGKDLVMQGSQKNDGDENTPVALLSLLPNSDNVIKTYLASAVSWATVTPMILPGYDDPAHYRRRLKSVTDAEEQRRLLTHLNDRIDALIRKAILQAGFSQTLADCAEIEWRKVGYWRGSDTADRYGVPDHLKRFPSYHVKLRWRDEHQRPVNIHGPICIGGGRFYGLGLFAAQ